MRCVRTALGVAQQATIDEELYIAELKEPGSIDPVAVKKVVVSRRELCHGAHIAGSAPDQSGG